MAVTQKLNCYLVDDEPSAIENLERLLIKYCPDIFINGHSSTVKQATEYLSTHTVDILFLDIRMQNETGFDLLTSLPDFSGSVVFVTAHDEYGLKAIKFSATDYLLKPVNSAELIAAVEKAGKRKNNIIARHQIEMLLQSVGNQRVPKQKKIALPDSEEIRYVEIESILYCKAANSYTHFFMADKSKIIVSKPISDYESLLTPYGFLRTHQSFLVNKDKIHSYKKEDGGYLLLEDGSNIPVSRQRKAMIKDIFNA